MRQGAWWPAGEEGGPARSQQGSGTSAPQTADTGFCPTPDKQPAAGHPQRKADLTPTRARRAQLNPRAGPSPCALTEAALSPRARGRLVGQSVGRGPTDLGGEGGELADGLTLATLYSERSSVWEKNLRTIRDKPPENKENSEVVTDSRRTQTR